MISKGQNLSENVAENILAMITIDKKFKTGDKLPNENDLANILSVSRTTLREAVKILATHQVLEIRRGKGTFVKDTKVLDEDLSLNELLTFKPDLKDLYEMRLIFEPEAAFYAAKRATEKELERILYYGILEEELLFNNSDRSEIEEAFHKSIAKATHNEFIDRLIPILYQAIEKSSAVGVKEESAQNTLTDHRMIMEFIAKRDAEGARTAMKLHTIHTMRSLGILDD